ADPRGHGAWGDYIVTMYDTLPDSTKSVLVANTFGNDYLAGGAHDDMLFGQGGNDVAQGDGSIDWVSHIIADGGTGTMTVAAGDKSGGRAGVTGSGLGNNIAGNPFRDSTNALILRPSFDASTDGQDYIEGGA